MNLAKNEVCDRSLASGHFKFRVCMVLMKISMILARFWSITGSKLTKTGAEKINFFYSRSCRYLAVLRLFFPDHMHWFESVSCVYAQRRHRKSTAKITAGAYAPHPGGICAHSGGHMQRICAGCGGHMRSTWGAYAPGLGGICARCGAHINESKLCILAPVVV